LIFLAEDIKDSGFPCININFFTNDLDCFIVTGAQGFVGAIYCFLVVTLSTSHLPRRWERTSYEIVFDMTKGPHRRLIKSKVDEQRTRGHRKIQF
jgi:hypothetical protein